MKTMLFVITFFISTCMYTQNDSKISPETIDKITKFVESKRDYYNSPSIAVAITDQDSTVYLKHFGNAKKGDQYLIGSNSKSFTALLTLLLQQKGLLNIKDPVRKYLTWFAYHNPAISDRITLEDLLQHTSGIPTEIGRMFKGNNPDFDYINYYKTTLKKLEVPTVPKQRFIYSNANYRLLGFVIETVTGKTYEQCLAEYITIPMDLTNTTASIGPNLIDSYQYFLYNPILKFNGSFHRQEIPSGSISSTASDMTKYLRNLMNSYNHNPNTILQDTITQQLFTPSHNARYALGWSVVKEPVIFYHSGTNESFESSMYILPSIQKSIIVMINSNQAPYTEVINGIYGILLGKNMNGPSSFPFYRALPLVVFALLISIFFLVIKWRTLGFTVQFTKKILPNILLILGMCIAIAFIIIFPRLNGVSLTTAIAFDPASGYSIVSISLFLFLISWIGYFIKTKLIYIKKFSTRSE
ncbi:serine hydrolase domain-containing protein [Tenacibaculum amylolyticum]|uniref:serine hydrolase domain-containing protein n=1 Tax=Tenacibaculum amylolyticum TaxID=104269 RepID=UPI0038937B5C